jgi:hypothetical protein
MVSIFCDWRSWSSIFVRHRQRQPVETALAQIVRHAGLDALRGDFVAEHRADQDKRNVETALLDATQGGQTVEQGQTVIGENDVDLRLQRRDKVGLALDPLPLRFEAAAA